MVSTENTTLIVAPCFYQDNTTFEEMIFCNKSINLQVIKVELSSYQLQWKQKNTTKERAMQKCNKAKQFQTTICGCISSLANQIYIYMCVCAVAKAPPCARCGKGSGIWLHSLTLFFFYKRGCFHYRKQMSKRLKR